MFLLKTGESLDIKIDSFIKSLKPLLSRYRIVKLLKSLSWLCSKRWSETEDGLHSTLFPVKYDISMCSLDLTLRIILVLHCGNEFLKHVLNFRFKLDDNVPRYGNTIKSSSLGTVGITFFRTWSLFKKILWIAL